MMQGNVWGYIFRELRDDLRDVGDDGLRPSETQQMDEHPGKVFPLVMRRAVSMGALDERAQDRLSELMDMIDPDEPDRGLDGCAFYVGFYQYDRRWMSGDEAAQELGVTKARVYEMLKTGRLKGFKVGREWRIFARSVVSARQ